MVWRCPWLLLLLLAALLVRPGLLTSASQSLPALFTPSPIAEKAAQFYDPSNIGVSDEVLSSATFWFVTLVCYIITFGMRFAERTADWAFKPQDSFILSEKVG